MTPREHAAELAQVRREEAADHDAHSLAMTTEADLCSDTDRKRLFRVKAAGAAWRASMALRLADAYQAVADGEEPVL